MIKSSELSEVALFAALDGNLRDRVVARSADIRVTAGEWVTREGDTPYFWTLLEGEVEVVKRYGGIVQQVTTFEPGEYFGEVPLMLGADSLLDVRAMTPARLMRTDQADFHFMVTASDEASAFLTQSLVRRVNFRRETYLAANLTEAAIVGDRYDLASHDIRDFLSRNQISYEWLDPSDPGDAAGIPKEILEAGRFPVVIIAGAGRLERPPLRALANGLKLETTPRSQSYDVAVIGGGPAGLAAAVYGGSEGLRTIMVEREAPGGQAGTSSRIENYLGFPNGISGDDLAKRALVQAKRFGTEILVTRHVASIHASARGYAIELDGGDRVEARTIIIATGVCWRRLESASAANLTGRGIYYGAARTEALGMRGKDVFLIGGGNSAGQAAMFFSAYARSVTLLVRGPSLAKSMSQYLIEQMATKQNISVETDTEVDEVGGDSHIESISTRHRETGAVTKRPADGLFVFIGADADTASLPGTIERDPRGYVKTGRDVERWTESRPPFPLETSVPGIFAAGDVRSGSVKRVASSVGEGSMAIAFIHEYLARSDT